MAPRPDPYAASRAHFAYYLSSAVASVLCVVLLYLAVEEAQGVLARRNQGVALKGTVTARREVHSSSNARGKRTVNVSSGSTTLEYTVEAAYQGQPVRVVNRSRSSLEEYRVGDQVPIVYVPGQPDYSRLATWTEQYGQLVQLLGFGLLCGVAASLLWLRKLTVDALSGGRPKLPPDAIR